MSQPMVLVQGLTRRFGSLAAVDGLNLSVKSGQIFGLLGRNGAGKTTLIKMLTTLLPPTGGSARIAGFDVVTQASSVRRVIGYVPQALSADGELTGYENLLVFSKLFDVPRRERAKRIGEALEFMGLSDVADKLVRSYSGGMIRRLEIAQSTLHRPHVLFLDEPTVGLDPLARHTVWEHVERLKARYKTTILLTTHYMDEADRLCEEIAILNHGHLVALGSPAELKAQQGSGATLDDVFAHYTADLKEEAERYHEISRARRTAERLG